MTEKYEDIINPQNEPNSKWEPALERAWEIRTFEINTSWKRTNYFSLVVGALFVGYYNIATADGDTNDWEMFFIKSLIILLGFVASLTWFFINKGSKFWQEKWEIDIDQMEKATGYNKLHSNVFAHKGKHHSCHPKRSYPFSVSKLNMLFSFLVTCAWGVLYIYEGLKHSNIINHLLSYFDCACIINFLFGILFILAPFILFFLVICMGQSHYIKETPKGVTNEENIHYYDDETRKE